jgi:AcrR family transcriptional regulator
LQCDRAGVIVNRMTVAAVAPQRELILNQAADAFAELGYAAASMSDLAQRCGVSKSLLYHYFISKEAILFALFDGYTERLLALCDAVSARGLTPDAHLDALVREFMAEYRTSRSVHKLLLQDVDHLPEPKAQEIKDQQRAVIEAFRGAVQRSLAPQLAGPELTAATMLLMGMINWTFTWLDPKGPVSYEHFASAVLAACRGGLTGLKPGWTRPEGRAARSPTRRRGGAIES